MVHPEIHGPLDVLKHEHHIIQLVLDAKPWAGGQSEAIAQTVEFFKEFAYHCHHTKEEKHLFPRMLQRGMPDPGLIPELIGEHRDGRQLIEEIAAMMPQLKGPGQGAALPVIQARFDLHARRLRLHIEKEETRLFPLVGQVLDEHDRQQLIDAFGKVESDEMGEGVHGKYVRFAKQLTSH
jgi:hemerythrin-like domain-containing protein